MAVQAYRAANGQILGHRYLFPNPIPEEWAVTREQYAGVAEWMTFLMSRSHKSAYRDPGLESGLTVVSQLASGQRNATRRSGQLRC